MRHTRSHTANRRSHHALKAPTLSVCGHCGASHRPHHMCLSCGYYNGRQVMDLTTEKTKRDARIKEKKERIKDQSGAVGTPEPTKPGEPVSDEHAETKTTVKRGARSKVEKKAETK